MSAATLTRQPSVSRVGFGRTLRLRLSNGYSWAHEFDANDAFSLREGCAEAHFEHRRHVDAEVNRYPAYQTRNREQARARVAGENLYLHVKHRRDWLNANYGTNSECVIFVRRPGTAPSGEAWSDADWADVWIRCVRCKSAAESLDRFCDNVVAELSQPAPKSQKARQCDGLSSPLLRGT